MSLTAHLIYFSPTGTTQKITTSIVQGLGAKNVLHYDVTLPDSSVETELSDGVAIIGVPVYAGRTPKLCLQRMQSITAKGLPCILVALYGNRAFEDALVELRDFATSQGFEVVAAGAFIGEHSYSTRKRPIAAGRPDSQDLLLAETFGQQVALKINNGNLTTPEIAGNVPYKERVKLGGVAPDTIREKCTLCGRCAEICPAGVITVSDQVVTEADHCIMCCACVKTCEVEARPFNHPRIEEKRAMLHQNCSQPKAPQFFL
jgi:ferredoxin